MQSSGTMVSSPVETGSCGAIIQYVFYSKAGVNT